MHGRQWLAGDVLQPYPVKLLGGRVTVSYVHAAVQSYDDVTGGLNNAGLQPGVIVLRAISRNFIHKPAFDPLLDANLQLFDFFCGRF
jgi:hypothetical protein